MKTQNLCESALFQTKNETLYNLEKQRNRSSSKLECRANLSRWCRFWALTHSNQMLKMKKIQMKLNTQAGNKLTKLFIDHQKNSALWETKRLVFHHTHRWLVRLFPWYLSCSRQEKWSSYQRYHLKKNEVRSSILIWGCSLLHTISMGRSKSTKPQNHAKRLKRR